MGDRLNLTLDQILSDWVRQPSDILGYAIHLDWSRCISPSTSSPSPNLLSKLKVLLWTKRSWLFCIKAILMRFSLRSLLESPRGLLDLRVLEAACKFRKTCFITLDPKSFEEEEGKTGFIETICPMTGETRVGIWEFSIAGIWAWDVLLRSLWLSNLLVKPIFSIYNCGPRFLSTLFAIPLSRGNKSLSWGCLSPRSESTFHERAIFNLVINRLTSIANIRKIYIHRFLGETMFNNLDVQMISKIFEKINFETNTLVRTSMKELVLFQTNKGSYVRNRLF